jgi:CBS domain-containing protein
MLVRERAWDVMRVDLVTVLESDSLHQVALSLREAMKDQPGKACALVLSESGEFKGVITAWWLLLSLEQSAMDDALKPGEGPDFEARFRIAGRKCFSRRAGEVVEHDVPVVRPQDPLFVVLGAMLASRRRWAVVMEGGKLLGAIAAEDLFMEMDWDALKG